MSDVDELVEKAQRQLDEHKKWLAGQIYTAGGMIDPHKMMLAAQASEIKLRVAKAAGGVVSVVYDYPDELFAFLSAETTPKHLRDTLAGGHVVDPNQRTYEAKRVHGE